MIPSIPFVKYHGTGNDFILLDEREIDYQLNTEEISKLCHRHFGIGADGLISLRKAPDADFRMVYYNADGREGSMCGNGGRCIVAFARSLGVIGERTRFIGVDGYHEAMFLPDKPGFVSLKMSDVAAPRKRVGYDFIDTGSPHVVVAVRDLAGYPVDAAAILLCELDGSNAEVSEQILALRAVLLEAGARPEYARRLRR